MATIRPFRALRPVPARAQEVAAVPYDVVTTSEARALASGNPASFLHVSRPEIDLPEGTDPHSDAVYRKGAENFARLEREGPLVRESEPSVYLYRLRMGDHEQTGVAAAYSLDEYDSGAIRRHERTRRDKEDDRTRHMITLGAQTGPVFLTYRGRDEIEALVRAATRGEPLYDFQAEDGVSHTVWKVGGDEAQRFVSEFARVPLLYIADGHHRAASASRARSELAGKGRGDAADSFLAVAFPDTHLRILPYNRVVKDLGTRTPEQFLAALRKKLPVSDSAPASPARRGEVSIYIGGRWHGLDFDDSGELDVTLLQDRVLDPILGIHDIRTDPRIDFVGGGRGTAALERAVDEGRAAAAFSLFPVSIEDLMRIADADGIMPPKSTWFEPKLRDGLLIHEL
ncbi:MAG: DUF1015 family protein, partial [Acidobacteriota bacterium]